jgi:hypothetical protein
LQKKSWKFLISARNMQIIVETEKKHSSFRSHYYLQKKNWYMTVNNF